MAELNPDFFKIAYPIIRGIMYRKADKYPQIALGYNVELSLKEYREDLFQDFMAYNFMERYKTYYERWKELEEKEFANYIARSIDNDLQRKRNQINPRSHNLWRNVNKCLEELSSERVIELFARGKGQRKTISRARTLFKDKESKSSAVDLYDILSIFKELDHTLFNNVAKETSNGVRINKNELKGVLKHIFSEIDGWIFIEDLQKALQSNIPLTLDCRIEAIGVKGEDEEDEVTLENISSSEHTIEEELAIRIKLKKCLKALTERQMRIFELKTDKRANQGKKLTYQNISEILKKENLGCDGSTVQREWKRIEAIFEDIMQKEESD